MAVDQEMRVGTMIPENLDLSETHGMGFEISF